jgi:hypothetical protein
MEYEDEYNSYNFSCAFGSWRRRLLRPWTLVLKHAELSFDGRKLTAAAFILSKVMTAREDRIRPGRILRSICGPARSTGYPNRSASISVPNW